MPKYERGSIFFLGLQIATNLHQPQSQLGSSINVSGLTVQLVITAE